EPPDLHRRDEHRALADRYVDRLTRRERPAALTPARHLRFREEAALLAGQVDGRRLAESERVRVLHDRRAADLQSRLVEEDVAGLRDRMVEVDRAVAALLPVLERRCAQMKLAVAVGPVERGDAAFLKASAGDGARERAAV